jgi:hypothetical protein
MWVIRRGSYFCRPNRSGYTADVLAAGLYTEAEAKREVAVDPELTRAIHVSEFADEIHRAREMIARFDGII